jgi:hypothetical protein
MTKYKVDEETAQKEFERMCEAFRIDLEAFNKADEDGEMRSKTVVDIRRGALIIGTDGLPTYTPATGTSVTFHPPTGATFMAMETYGSGKNIANTIAAGEAMTESHKGTFAKMAREDFRACMRLTNLFLADL